MKYAVIAASFLLFLDLINRTGITNREKIRRNIKKAKGSNFMKLLCKPGTEIYEKEKRLLQKARLNISVESFQLIKLASFVISLIIVFSAFVTHHNMKIDEVLNQKSINISIINNQKTLENGDVFLNKLTNQAYKEIDFRRLIEGGEYKRLQDEVYSLVNEMELEREQALDYAKKVYNNLLFIYDNRLKSIHIIMIILFSLSGANIPKIIARIRMKKTENLMETELNKLEILTLLLLKKEDMNIYQILLKLKSKSKVLRPYLKKCVNNFQKDGRKAMEVMQKEADFKPFTDFINILKQGIDTNKKTTFTVLEMSRRLRNEIYQLMVKEKTKRKNRNILITRFPMLLVALYLLLLPWIIIFKENF